MLNVAYRCKHSFNNTTQSILIAKIHSARSFFSRMSKPFCYKGVKDRSFSEESRAASPCLPLCIIPVAENAFSATISQ